MGDRSMKKVLCLLVISLFFSVNAYSVVNINTASQEELESIKGIGPSKAKAIIDYRKKNGQFKSINDLDNVNGIGAATLEDARKDITLTGKTTVKVKDTDKKKMQAKVDKKANKDQVEKTKKEQTKP
jgi:competence protein ComEA